jgi:hypothetical protein
MFHSMNCNSNKIVIVLLICMQASADGDPDTLPNVHMCPPLFGRNNKSDEQTQARGNSWAGNTFLERTNCLVYLTGNARAHTAKTFTTSTIGAGHSTYL